MKDRLLFDLTATQALGPTRHHGASEYAQSVLRALLDRQIGPASLSGFFWRDMPLEPWIAKCSNQGQLTLIPIDSRHDITGIVGSVQPRCFYSALPYRLNDVDINAPRVWLTIHGLRVLEVPTDRYQIHYQKTAWNKLRFLKQYTFKSWHYSRERQRLQLLFQRHRNATIIVPSRHTKHALMTLFPEVKDRDVRLLYSPRPNFRSSTTGFEKPPPLDEVQSPYFLLLNADRWIKNSYRAVHAFDQFFRVNSELPHTVVLVGSPGPATFGRLQEPTRFLHLPYLQPDSLCALYAHAHAFFYPTLNEGFGYPPLEAMNHGVPVAAAATSSVPEICGDAALYFNPYDLHEMKCRISQLCYDPLDTLRSRAKERVQEIADQQDTMLDELIDALLAKDF